MKKVKKILGLVILLLLFTGCEATYNLEIEDDTFSEDIDLFISKSELTTHPLEDGEISYQEYIDMQQNNNYPALFNDYTYNPYEDEEGIKQDGSYYNQKLINESNRYGMNYTYKFKKDEYVNSRAVNTCFKEFSVAKSGNAYTLRTNNLARCFDNYKMLDKLTVNLKLDYLVVHSNADRINDKTYTWEITKDNYKGKNITLVYKADNTEENGSAPENPDNPETPNNPSNPSNPNTPNSDTETEKENNILNYILVGGVVGLFIIGIFGFIKYKSLR